MKNLKSIFLSGMACTLLFGCSSNSVLTKPEDVFEKLKENGYEFELNYKFDDDNVKRYTFTAKSNNDRVIGYYEINDVYKVVMVVDGTNKTTLDYVDNNSKKNLVLSKDTCHLDYKTEQENKDIDPNAECSEDILKELKSNKKAFSEILKDLNVNEDSLMDFSTWYVEKNKDKATKKESAADKNLLALGFKKSENGSYSLFKDMTIGEVNITGISIDTDKQTFNFQVKDKDKTFVIIEYKEKTLTFMKNDKYYNYDTANKRWINTKYDSSEEINALKYYTGYLQFCNQNNVYLD